MSKLLTHSHQKAKKLRDAALKDAESGVRPLSSEHYAAEPLACPECGHRYDFGDRCIDCDVRLIDCSLVRKQPEANKPIVVDGPRYQCEACGERSDDHIGCPSCGGASMLDLSNYADVQYLQALDAISSSGFSADRDLGLKIGWIGLVGIGVMTFINLEPSFLRLGVFMATLTGFLVGLFRFSTVRLAHRQQYLLDIINRKGH